MKALLGKQMQQETLAEVGIQLPMSDYTAVRNCESFICQLYTTVQRDGTKADDVRYWLFICQKQKQGLLPTSDSLSQHKK